MIDLYFRCETQARWRTFAQNQGIYDANNRTNPGFLVDEIGFFQLTDPVMSGMTVVTPATFDTWWSVNVRIFGAPFTADQDTVYTGELATSPWLFIRSKKVRALRDTATVRSLPFRGDTIRAYEIGTTPNRVQVLDPRDITFPRRQWLGGMAL